MADRLRVTELDFDTIKNNLKLFLSQQSEFTDYDFEGAGLSTLLDILAYNTHYNAYYLNMVANEAFLDTALLRDSVVSHAKTLGYTPHSQRASVATINFTVQSSNSDQGTLTIPPGYSFLSNQIDNRTYNFIVLEDTVVTKANSQYIFENLQIAEGQLITYNFVQEQATNPKQIFTLPDPNIDTTTIRVLVRQSLSNTSFEVYNRVDDVNDVTGEDSVYFLQETRGERYQIYFGNGSIGKAIPDNSVVSVSYLVTNDTQANKANNFIATAPLVDSNSESINDFIIEPIVAAAGGADRESVDSIKLLAPTQFVSQNRLVTKNDYGSFLQKNYLAADSISVWGGEEQPQKAYGKIFISIKPKDGFFVSETEKRRIITDILQPKNIVGTNVEILDPDFLFIKTNSIVKYDRSKTTRNASSIIDSVKNSIINYKNTSINRFGSNFVLSKLENQISTVDNSIIGSETSIRVEKRIVPILNTTASYIIDFGVSLNRGTLLNRLVSNDFRISDGGVIRIAQIEETPQSFTGVEQILITDPGFGFTSTPTVTITGDGFGATAEARIVNGKVQSIQITNRGVNYTQAVVSIRGGGGVGASATALVSGRIGNLRVVFFDANAEKRIIKPNVGNINYDTGLIEINDLNIISLVSGPFLKIDVESERSIIESSRNIIITIDEFDPTAIIVAVEESDDNY
jgi:hypothetical protein